MGEECAKQILRIPVVHPTFETVVIETIMSQMLRLPFPPLLPLFYSRLLQVITDHQFSLKQVVSDAFSIFFERLDDVDEECLDRLAEAFAYHLIHREYEANWEVFAAEEISSTTSRFLRCVLERLQRLSYHNNLVVKFDKLPEIFKHIPPDPLPVDSLPAQTTPEFKRMTKFIRIKEPDERLVLKYCMRLMKLSKEEHEEDSDTLQSVKSAPKQGGPEHEVVTKAPAKGEGEEEEPERAKADGFENLEDECSVKVTELEMNEALAEPVAGIRDDSDEKLRGDRDTREESNGTERKHKLDAEEKDDSPEAKRRRLSVKEEVKREDEAQAEDDWGSPPVEAWPFRSVIRVFVLALLQNSSKTPTHMSKMLDGHQRVFAKLRPEEEEELKTYGKEIVSCVFDFWRQGAHRLEITLDTLLQRGIVSAQAIVEHALADPGPLPCDGMPVWNMINLVARKSLERSQSLRAELAVGKKLGKLDVVDRCKGELDAALLETSDLFTLIFAGLVRNHQDAEGKDDVLRHIMLQRILLMGRRYHAFIKPVLEAAESRIPGVAHSSDVSHIFQLLKSL